MNEHPYSSGPLMQMEKPSSFPYFLALVLFLVGNYFLFQGLRASFSQIKLSDPLYVYAPGVLELQVDEPMSFTLWNEVRTVINGEVLTAPSSLPKDIEFAAWNKTTKKVVTFSLGGGSTVKASGGKYVRHSIGGFHADEPGSYALSIRGNFPERIFSLRQDFFASVLQAFRLDLFWLAVAWLAAPVVCFFTWRSRAAYQAPRELSGDGSGVSASSAAFDFSEHDPKFESARDRREHQSFGRQRDNPLDKIMEKSPKLGELLGNFTSRPGRRSVRLSKDDSATRIDTQSERRPERKKKKGPRFQRSSKDSVGDRSFASLCHFSGLAGFIMPLLGNIIAPVIMLSAARERSDFVVRHAKRAINFQISMSIAFFGCMLFSGILIGLLCMPIVVIFWFKSMLGAAARARNGEEAEYSYTIEFLS